jgi:hypothetical protein
MMTVADPNEFTFFRAGDVSGSLRGKANELEFVFFRGGEPMVSLCGVLIRPRGTTGVSA